MILIKYCLYLDLQCPNCVIQWRYIAGNNWGMCADGTGAVGCGAQEEFRACADINIGDVGPQTPLRPFRPIIAKTTTQKPKPTVTPATPSDAEPGSGTQPEADGPRYLGPIIAALALLVVLCLLAMVYLYHYHGQRVKHFMRWKRDQKTAPTAAPFQSVVSTQPQTSLPPPVPPPRTKRLSQSLPEIDPNESSVLNGSPS